MTRNRIDMKTVLADPLIREELIESATDFICKVENIRRERDSDADELFAIADGLEAQ